MQFLSTKDITEPGDYLDALTKDKNTTAEMEMPKFYRKEFALVLDTRLLQIKEKTEKIIKVCI